MSDQLNSCYGYCDVSSGLCVTGSLDGIECLSDEDCPGFWNGSAVEDICGICGGFNILSEYCSDNSIVAQEDCEAAEHAEWFSKNIGPDVGCDGVCFSGIELDDCGICGGENLTIKIGSSEECIYPVYPGDTNMDGNVQVDDIYPIVKYWGKAGIGSREGGGG